MSDEAAGTPLQGTCLCGAVSMQLMHPRPALSACHCDTCRTWSGGPFLALECPEPPHIEGSEHVRTYASSAWAERGFCERCGTHLFYRLKEGGIHALPAGLFKDSGQWPFELQIFIDKKPANYHFAETTKTLTGEAVFKDWP